MWSFGADVGSRPHLIVQARVTLQCLGESGHGCQEFAKILKALPLAKTRQTEDQLPEGGKESVPIGRAADDPRDPCDRIVAEVLAQ